MAQHIAIVEDDSAQRDNYHDALTKAGFKVDTYANRPNALNAFNTALPGLVILDIMLEDERDGGFDLCRELRSMDPYLPIIFLTSRDADVDRVSGLRLDAWDYITKPVNLDYLAVRIDSLFRISNKLKTGATPLSNGMAQSDSGEPKENDTVLGDLILSPESMKATWQGKEIPFTLTEFWLVDSLVQRPGVVKTYDNLMQITRQSYVEKNSINGYVRRIRKKFKEVDPEFKKVITVFGVGYKWQD